MPHIKLPEGYYGISSLFQYSPETALPMRLLAERILRKESLLSNFERETIAAFVSSLNECEYCTNSHTAIAKAANEAEQEIVDAVIKDYKSAPINDLMKALLTIAKKVQQDAKKVLQKDIELALSNGATDEMIHDTVLIAAAFCMYNKYVDGLATVPIQDVSLYNEEAQIIKERGYDKKETF